jgi:hypothetical protein
VSDVRLLFFYRAWCHLSESIYHNPYSMGYVFFLVSISCLAGATIHSSKSTIGCVWLGSIGTSPYVTDPVFYAVAFLGGLGFASPSVVTLSFLAQFE